MSKEPNRNVYVGHRYVPLILEEWDNKISYEGLSVVTHKGGSYTSKKRVPVGIDILNKEFWSLTGNYNAQVDYYREETERVAQDLLLKSDQTYVDTELGKKSDKTYVDTELGKVDTELNKKANKTYVDTELGKKSDKTYVDTELGKKSDKSYVDTELGKKSDQTYVDTELGKKANQTYVNTELDKKVDKDNNMVNVKHFGAMGDGVTIDNDAIHNAIENVESGGVLRFPKGTYLIDADGTGWNGQTDAGIIIRKPMTVIIDKEAVLKAQSTDNVGYCVLSVVDTENVSIIGGRIEGERFEHTGTTGEFGFGLKIDTSKNIVVRDLIIENCWGDGAILRVPQKPDLYVENVLFDNVIMNRNRRNGFTAGAVKNVVLRNCTFSNTYGTMPQAGIDIEPDGVTNQAENVLIDGCKFFGNKYQDIAFGGGNGVKDVKIVNSDFNSDNIGITAKGTKNPIDHFTLANTNIFCKANGFILGNIENNSITNLTMETSKKVGNIGITVSENTNVEINNSKISDFFIGIDITGDNVKSVIRGSQFKNFNNTMIRNSGRNEFKVNLSECIIENIKTTSLTQYVNSIFINNDFIESNLYGTFEKCRISNNNFKVSDLAGIGAHVTNGCIINDNMFNSPTTSLAINSLTRDTETKISPSVITGNMALYGANPFNVDPADIMGTNFTSQDIL